MTLVVGKIIESAERLVDQGRLIPAVLELKRARSLTEIPSRKVFITFNLGAIYWEKFGDGVAAKSEFDTVARAGGPEYEHAFTRTLKANAFENLMLCASSYTEFDTSAAHLRSLTPGAPILAGLIPVVHEMRDAGNPWSAVMIRLAMSNYNRNDPAQDRGRYGVAKATYDLLLRERTKHRLSREDWGLVVGEYLKLAIRMTTACMTLRGGDRDLNPPSEFFPILTDSLPFIDEYLARFPGDEGVQNDRNAAASILNNLNQRWSAIAPGQVDVPLQAPSGAAPRYRCSGCKNLIPHPAEACTACGHTSAISALMPMTFLGSLAAAFIVWQVLHSRTFGFRALSASAAAVFVFAVIGPIVYTVWLAMLRERDS